MRLCVIVVSELIRVPCQPVGFFLRFFLVTFFIACCFVFRKSEGNILFCKQRASPGYDFQDHDYSQYHVFNIC
jgi:hypothetical protein